MAWDLRNLQLVITSSFLITDKICITDSYIKLLSEMNIDISFNLLFVIMKISFYYLKLINHVKLQKKFMEMTNV